MDHETYDLFSQSNFDAYDRDRYAPVLREGLRQHGLELSDVLAVSQDLGLWAICRTGVFRADLRGFVKKRIEVDKFVDYRDVASVYEKPSGPKTKRLVLEGADSKELARIDFSAGGMENTPEIADGHRRRVAQIMEDAWTRAQGT